MRPVLPYALGFAGVLPFAAATLALWIGPDGIAPAARTAVMAYGVIILSFLGGVHWGVALREGGAARFLWSVTPSLIALAAVFAADRTMLFALAAAYVLAGAVDVVWFGRTGPGWYVRLRIWLTALVAPLLAVAALAL